MGEVALEILYQRDACNAQEKSEAQFEVNCQVKVRLKVKIKHVRV